MITRKWIIKSDLIKKWKNDEVRCRKKVKNDVRCQKKWKMRAKKGYVRWSRMSDNSPSALRLWSYGPTSHMVRPMWRTVAPGLKPLRLLRAQLQVIFHKRATNYRAILREMTCKDKASYGSWPPCIEYCNINQSRADVWECLLGLWRLGADAGGHREAAQLLGRCVCVYACMHVCVFLCVCVCICACMYINPYIYIYVLYVIMLYWGCATSGQLWMCAYMYACICMHMYMYMYMHMSSICIYICACMYINLFIYVYVLRYI